MNFIPRLHQLLLEIKKHLRESRLLFRQRKHRLIHHLQSQRRLHSLPVRIRHMKLDPRLTSPVDLTVASLVASIFSSSAGCTNTSR